MVYFSISYYVLVFLISYSISSVMFGTHALLLRLRSLLKNWQQCGSPDGPLAKVHSGLSKSDGC